jgi:hypothetical protein
MLTLAMAYEFYDEGNRTESTLVPTLCVTDESSTLRRHITEMEEKIISIKREKKLVQLFYSKSNTVQCGKV